MTIREFNEWMAYYSIEPFGIDREDYRAGMICSTIANIHRDPKKKTEAWTPEDFIPRSKAEHKKYIGRKVLNKMKGLFTRGN